MAVVNVTPDSFSDGGRYLNPDAAISHGLALCEEGADILDIGAESTRPGAATVSVQQELDRLLPVIEGLRNCGRPLSIDTRRPQVMLAVLAAGVDMINDVGGFRSPQAREMVGPASVALCLMHMQGEPSTMQQAPVYRDVVSEVTQFLYLQAQLLVVQGVARERIVLDPGIGFGKTQEQNVELLRAVPQWRRDGWPVLVGVSRKSLIGHLTGRALEQRLAGSLGAAVAAVLNGANFVRVHDVAATKDALLTALTLANR